MQACRKDTLFLNGNKITDGRLKELGELKNLISLGLGQTEITDAGLKQLRESLPNTSIY